VEYKSHYHLKKKKKSSLNEETVRIEENYKIKNNHTMVGHNARAPRHVELVF